MSTPPMTLADLRSARSEGPGWIAVAAMCDAHIAARPGIVPALAAKWGMA